MDLKCLEAKRRIENITSQILRELKKGLDKKVRKRKGRDIDFYMFKVIDIDKTGFNFEVETENYEIRGGYNFKKDFINIETLSVVCGGKKYTFKGFVNIKEEKVVIKENEFENDINEVSPPKIEIDYPKIN